MKAWVRRWENTGLEMLLRGLGRGEKPIPAESQCNRVCTHPNSLQGNRLQFLKSLGMDLATKVVSHLIILSLLGAQPEGEGEGEEGEA